MNIQEEYIKRLLSEGTRIDGRKPEEFRKIEIKNNPIYKAEGSAWVRLGDTEVIAGVKMSVGQPFPDRPEEGVLIAGAEFSPVASPEFETGPPRENAIELARVVDRGIRESKAIDMEKLCIEKGEKVWIVNLDVHVLNHSGNLIDAAGIAAIQALLNARIPEYDGEKINYEAKKERLPVRLRPVPVSVVKIGDRHVLDPVLEEEDVADAMIVITSTEEGNVSAIQKRGSGPITLDDVDKALELSVKKGNEIRKLLR